MSIERILSGIERQEQLLNYVTEHQRMTISQICDHFGVSPATARRDLESLAERGEIERFHGGAKAIQHAPPEASAHHREIEQSVEKARIGKATAELINENETIFLGSGTTVLEVARNLHQHRNLTVITNSLLVINALSNMPNIDIICLGGMLRRTEMSMMGRMTEQAFSEFNAHKIIISIRAIDLDRGLTNDYSPETMMDRSILEQQSGEVIVVADHTKCERISTAFVAPITVISKFVTDDKTDSGFVDGLIQQGIDAIIV